METLNDAMQAYAEDAVAVSKKQYNIILDYSADSIRHIEGLAAGFHADMPKGRAGKLFKNPPDPVKLDGICMSLGGYVGEILRRAKGGNWEFQSDLHTLGLVFPDGSWVYPTEKLYKRIVYGADNNLVAYFALVSRPTTEVIAVAERQKS